MNLDLKEKMRLDNLFIFTTIKCNSQLTQKDHILVFIKIK